ncbi:MAG: pyruvate ferredoxin oxidoreductase, partial [Planctomycetota bacterium]
MATGRMRDLLAAEAGEAVVLQGNLAFALGCARGGIHAADGYPGTPSTEVIDKGLRHLQDHMRVGWSVNEATAVGLGFGATMAGDDVVVTLKIPGLFQAADVVATVAAYTAPRGGLVLYIASDFTPSSTQYVTDPRYFLKSCFVPILEPRSHQEMYDVGARAAALAREVKAPVVVLASGILCHSEGLVRLDERREVPRLDGDLPWKRFMNLPRIARQNYETIHGTR